MLTKAPKKYDAGHSPAHRTETWINPPILKKAIEKLRVHNASIDPLVQQALLPPSEPKILLHALCLKLVDLAEDV